MTAMNPDLQLEAAKNVERALFGTAPTMTVVGLAYGPNAAEQWLLPQLHSVTEFCGCRDKLSDRQMRELASMIAVEFGYLKVSEVMLFLYRLKSGRYGKFYGAMDPMSVMIALRQRFMAERAEAIDERERREAECERERHRRQVEADRARARAEGRNLYEIPPGLLKRP